MMIFPAGDQAVLVKFGENIDMQVNRTVHALANWLAAAKEDGIVETVAGYSSLLVYYDPDRMQYERLKTKISSFHENLIQSVRSDLPVVEIPVIYGKAYGPDLEFVAERSGLLVEEVIQIHLGGNYQVMMIGFTPGFAYLGGMDARIACPRLDTPRRLVPAGSVGIAGMQTGIYSVDSPGGWQIIGRTSVEMFNPQRIPPAYLTPGQQVRFIRRGVQ